VCVCVCVCVHVRVECVGSFFVENFAKLVDGAARTKKKISLSIVLILVSVFFSPHVSEWCVKGYSVHPHTLSTLSKPTRTTTS